jgi:hypothetical protein
MNVTHPILASILLCVTTEVSPRPEGERSSISPVVTVRTVEGVEHRGTILLWSLDGNLIMMPDGATGPSPARLPGADIDRVVVLEPSALPSAEWRAITTDGQVISGTIVGGNEEWLHLRATGPGLLRIPLERLAVVSRDGIASAATPNARNGQPFDLVYLVNDDVVRGILGGASANGLDLVVDGEARTIPWEVVRSLHLVEAREAVATRPVKHDLRVLLRFSDGTQLLAGKFSWREKSIQAEVLESTPIHFDVAAIQSVEVIGGRRVWLSDLTPVSFESRPLFGPVRRPVRDANAVCEPLRAAGGTYSRGVGLHAACTVTWEFEKEYQKLSALVAMDDSAGPLADATVRVVVDDREVWRVEPLRAGEPPCPLDIDLRGAGRLTVIVDEGAFGDVHDRVNLLDAALIRAQ